MILKLLHLRLHILGFLVTVFVGSLGLLRGRRVKYLEQYHLSWTLNGVAMSETDGKMEALGAHLDNGRNRYRGR